MVKTKKYYLKKESNMNIGYSRVSTTDQNVDLQTDAIILASLAFTEWVAS